MEHLVSFLPAPDAILALLTLNSLELVLGVDNIIVLTIMVNRLPLLKQPKARFMGLGLAMVTRIALLISLTWIMKLSHPLFTLMNKAISGRDLILLAGGLLLIGKSTLKDTDPELSGSFWYISD